MPPSPDTSRALVAAFAEREHRVRPRPPRELARRGARRRRARRRQRAAVRPLPRRAEAPRARRRARERHDRGRLRARSSPRTLETRFPGVYAVGDVATVGVPKAGVFAEGAARVVAQLADRAAARRRASRAPTTGAAPATSSSAPAASAASTSTSSRARSRPGTFQEPSAALVAEKEHFGSSRRARWFG